MADQFIALDEPAVTDKKLDTSELAVGANTVQRERLNIADPTTAAGIASVLNATPTTEYGLVVRFPALPTGSNVIGALSADQTVNATKVAGTTIDTNSGAKSAGTIRVVLATDQPALSNKLLVTPDSVALPANQSVNVAQVAGTATSVNSGTKDAGTVRVVLATDQPALTNKLLVTPDSVALPANQSVNVSQINGVTPLMGAGNTGTGSPRVTIATDQATIPVSLASVPSHPVTNAGTFVVQENGSQVVADDAPFTPATTKVVMSGLQADETATDSVDEGDAGAARMTLDRKAIVTPQPHTQGGLSSYSALSTAAVLTAAVKASAGQIYEVDAFNTGTGAIFVRLYDMATAPASTDGANIIWRGVIPGTSGSTGAGFVKASLHGRVCAAGIGIRVTGAVADNDTTALSANQVLFNVGYK